VGSLYSDTSLTFTQGNGNLIDNPPLGAVEGQAMLGYHEQTNAISGNITYVKNLDLDTSGQPLDDNLQVVRYIDYTNTGDGDGLGIMYSAESVMIKEDVNASSTTDSTTDICCLLLPTGTSDVLPASSVYVKSGSEVFLQEGNVTSVSKANIVSDVSNEGVSLGYTVDVGGSGQTGNATAVGKATVYTESLIMEGSDAANLTTKVESAEKVTVDGLITIAMNTVYSSSN